MDKNKQNIQKKQKRKKAKNKNSFKIVIILLISAIVSIVVGSLIFLILSNHKTIDFRTYFSFGNKIVTVKYDKYQTVTNPPVFIGEDLYISFDYVKENIDEYIYWDKNLSKLTITTSDEVIRFKSEDTTYFVNDEPFSLDLPVVMVDGVPYIPKSLIESLYDFTIDYKSDTNIVVVNDMKINDVTSVLKSDATLRYEPKRKSVIEDKIKKGENVVIFDEYDDYTKIMKEDGKIGYIKTNKIKKEYNVIYEDYEPKVEYTTTPFSGKINMVWDNITNVYANSTPEARKIHSGVNVLSPTWFKFDRNKLDGTIISYADKDYVDYAHRNGYMVWGLVSDVADSYDGVVLSNVISNSDYRQWAIKQLLSYVTIYDLDGLNIDFEMLSEEDSDSYVQFFRELYPYMKAEGKYLSVDMNVPQDWSSYYRREDVQKSVDYFCIMAYDEHYSGDKIGPVASINFVENGIINTLKEVPNEKVILGLPFYTRIWATEIVDGQEKSYRVGDYSIDTAMQRFKDNNAEFRYDATTGYQYGEYTIEKNGNTVTYKAWLEDLDSLKLKVDLVNKYNLKGTAGWRRGLEPDGTFEMIDNTIN